MLDCFLKIIIYNYSLIFHEIALAIFSTIHFWLSYIVNVYEAKSYKNTISKFEIHNKEHNGKIIIKTFLSVFMSLDMKQK